VIFLLIFLPKKPGSQPGFLFPDSIILPMIMILS